MNMLNSYKPVLI